MGRRHDRNHNTKVLISLPPVLICVLLVCLQDLSSFAMPHLDADDNMATEMDGDFRGRSGSNSSTGSPGVFRGIFRKKSRSGDQETPMADSGSRGNSPSRGTPGTSSSSSKVKNFLESFRPRSKSDAQSNKHGAKQSGPQKKISVPYPGPYGGAGGGGDGRQRHVSTPMSRLLSVESSPTSPSVLNKNALFPEDYRNRAFSDPRSSLQAARRAAASKVTKQFYAVH